MTTRLAKCRSFNLGKGTIALPSTSFAMPSSNALRSEIRAGFTLAMKVRIVCFILRISCRLISIVVELKNQAIGERAVISDPAGASRRPVQIGQPQEGGGYFGNLHAVYCIAKATMHTVAKVEVLSLAVGAKHFGLDKHFRVKHGG